MTASAQVSQIFLTIHKRRRQATIRKSFIGLELRCVEMT